MRFDSAVRSELTNDRESGDEHALRDEEPVVVPTLNQLRQLVVARMANVSTIRRRFEPSKSLADGSAIRTPL